MNKYSWLEIVIFFFIIGVFVALMAWTISYSHAKVRDAKRLSDVKQIQAALELYFNDHNQYPVSTNSITLGEGSSCVSVPCLVLGDQGFSGNAQGITYMPQVPANPAPNGTPYMYVSDGKMYFIQFSLERELGAYTAGTLCAQPSGVSQGSCQ